MRASAVLWALATAQATLAGTGATAEAADSGAAAVRAVGPGALVVLAGVPDRAQPAAPWKLPNDARRFYINSQSGNDSNDGLAEKGDENGHGPWRSFTRLGRADLRPGDAVLLACGSVWQQTLSLPVSGTPDRPLYVGVAPGQTCTTRPTIHGRLHIAASAWVPVRGAIHRTTLDTPPLQLFSPTSLVAEAHHPNRGHLSSDPSSPYLVLPAPGNVVAKDTGGSGSNQVTLGPELQLPSATPLTPGTRFHVRTNAWLIDDTVVKGVTGRQLNLARPTSYPLQAGWGYYLTGQAWMVDSPGEWHFDPSTRALTYWAPDSAEPGAEVLASVLDTGIDLRNRHHIVVDGVAVSHAGTGIDLRHSTQVRVRNCALQDLANRGVNAASTQGATVESTLIVRTGLDALGGHMEGEDHARALTAVNNLIRDSGVLMDGDTVLSLPRRSQGAIHAGPGSVVSGNAIVNAGYHGIRLWGESTVENNLVVGACSVLDDCGAIYTWSSSDSSIRNNIVAHTRSPLSGKPAGERHSQSQGIYLDWATSRIAVQGNSVAGADNGIQVHVGEHHALVANHLYGNRHGQLWLQETSNARRGAGDLHDISVSHNLLAPVRPSASGLRLQTRFGSTAGFGVFDANRYLDAPGTVAVAETSAGRSRELSFSQWQSATATGLPAGRDAKGSSTGAGQTWYGTSGANLVPNAALSNNTAGWSTWNATPPAAQLLREPCPGGLCVRLVAGGSASLLSSPHFSVQKGQWYRLSVDLATAADEQRVTLVLRRGGGGRNGYENLADRVLPFVAGRAWRRHSALFQATADVTAGNPVTGDLGARVDMEGVPPGHGVSLARLEVVPVQPLPLAGLSAVLLNAAAVSALRPCPFTGPQAAACTRLLNLETGASAVWPLRVPAHGSVIVVGHNPQGLDSDSDGIPDHQDQCPNTPAHSMVDAAGCGLDQR